MEAELMAALAQFGAAGLIGWMWLSERRSSAEREEQITYAHRRLKEQEHDRAVLIALVRDATRAWWRSKSGSGPCWRSCSAPSRMPGGAATRRGRRDTMPP